VADTSRPLRGRLRDEAQRLVDSDDPSCLVFAENVAFNSPSAAASAVMAQASNGRRNWQVAGTAQTHAEWQDSKLAEVAQSGRLKLEDNSKES